MGEWDLLPLDLAAGQENLGQWALVTLSPAMPGWAELQRKNLASVIPDKMLKKYPPYLHLFLHTLTFWKVHYESPDQHI